MVDKLTFKRAVEILASVEMVAKDELQSEVKVNKRTQKKRMQSCACCVIFVAEAPIHQPNAD